MNLPPIIDRRPPQLRAAFVAGYSSGSFFAHEVEAYAGEERADFFDGVAQRERDDYADSLDTEGASRPGFAGVPLQGHRLRALAGSLG